MSGWRPGSLLAVVCAGLVAAWVCAGHPAAAASPAATPAKVQELCRELLDDSTNYKVRVQAALVLGRLGDTAAVPALTKALADSNKTVRAIAAQALGQIGDAGAAEALRTLLAREGDTFVRTQAEKALASLSTGAVNKRAKI